ncbi:MAG: 2-amino-4-hydroxy-6-hydroxymethyldihydropteridine diphosphokinase [Firmicutes bacterium]|nr:2-amino-4-hydroxy-6-hydroxymethyldihydropteridine diphosphokinase [Bacillota bacterium]
MKIYIDSLECFAKHGVLKEENILGQKFLISACLETDIVSSDKVEDCVNYAQVCDFIKTYTEENVFNLIETLADSLAKGILCNFNVKSVNIKVEKPWAPIGLPLKTVAVEVKRSFERVYISLGSNMGDKNENISFAVDSIQKSECVKNFVLSTVLETEPYGYEEQDKFLNAAAGFDTFLTPWELLDLLHSIENERGRKREIHWGPRTLDLDIVLFGNITVSDKDLIIPHIDMHNRYFVLKPLFDIAPYAVHPLYGKTVKDLYESLEGTKC